MMMKKKAFVLTGDDGTHPSAGILLTAKRVSGGKIRIVLDRVRQNRDGAFELEHPVSYRDFPEARFVGAEMTDDEEASIGSIVLAELIGRIGN